MKPLSKTTTEELLKPEIIHFSACSCVCTENCEIWILADGTEVPNLDVLLALEGQRLDSFCGEVCEPARFIEDHPDIDHCIPCDDRCKEICSERFHG